MEKVFIVLPVHNRREVTQKFVECLKRQTYAPYHLILVDDGSTDGTAEMVREGIPGATVIRGNGGWWWAGSLQQGLNWLKAAQPATGDVVMFINDDVLFDRDYLRSALDVLRVNPGSMFLSRLRDPHTGEVRESGVHVDFRRMNFTIAASPAEINCLSTRGLFIRWEDVGKIGDFRPWLLPHYLSDYEYTIRGRRRGLGCITSEMPAIEMDQTKTGFRDFGKDDFRTFFSRYFSKKSASNPFYWSAFVILAAPFPWNLIGVLRVWKGAGKAILLKAVAIR